MPSRDRRSRCMAPPNSFLPSMVLARAETARAAYCERLERWLIALRARHAKVFVEPMELSPNNKSKSLTKELELPRRIDIATVGHDGGATIVSVDLDEF